LQFLLRHEEELSFKEQATNYICCLKEHNNYMYTCGYSYYNKGRSTYF